MEILLYFYSKTIPVPKGRHFFWSAPRIATYGQTRFSDLAQSIRFVFDKKLQGTTDSKFYHRPIRFPHLTGSQCIADFRCWTSPAVPILGAGDVYRHKPVKNHLKVEHEDS